MSDISYIMYSNLLPSSASSVRLNHDSLFGFLPRFLSSASLYRDYLFSYPSLCRFCLTFFEVFSIDQCLTVKVFCTRRLVDGSGSHAKRFCRVLELTQEVLCLRLCVRNTCYLVFCFCIVMKLLKHFFVSRLTPDLPSSHRQWSVYGCSLF